MAAAIGLMIAAAIFAAIGGLIYFLVKGDHNVLTFHNALRVYLTAACLISLGVFLVGISQTLTAGMAAAFGHDFSYQSFNIQPASCPPGDIKCPSFQAPPDSRQQDDLIRGISLLVAGLVLGTAHKAGQIAMDSKQERRDSGLAKAESIFATGVFGLVSIVAIPLAAYSVIRYIVVGHAQNQYGGPPNPPGPELAAALVFLPAWLFYLSGVVRRVRRDRESPAT